MVGVCTTLTIPAQSMRDLNWNIGDAVIITVAKGGRSLMIHLDKGVRRICRHCIHDVEMHGPGGCGAKGCKCTSEVDV